MRSVLCFLQLGFKILAGYDKGLNISCQKLVRMNYFEKRKLDIEEGELGETSVKRKEDIALSSSCHQLRNVIEEISESSALHSNGFRISRSLSYAKVIHRRNVWFLIKSALLLKYGFCHI